MVWDFAGQAVYHAIHPIFLLQEDLYVLVSDLTQELCTPAQCRVRTHNDEKVVESPHDEDTNLDHMMRWLDLVHSLVKKKSESLRGNLPSDAPLASLPPVVLVGTHADGVTNPREKMDFVFKTICNKASRATVEHISKESFFIDNSNPNRDNDRQIVSLRKELLDLCERMPHINNEIPLQWLRVEEKIHQMVTDRQVRYVCKKSFKEDIAEGICQINNTDDVEELLHFLQARGSVIYQDHPEKPDGLVVLDPEWLIRVLSMIITVSPPWKNDPSIQKDYEFLKRRGLLSQQLLNRAFKHLELEGIRDSLIHIMEKFLVICDSKNCNGKEYPYFVPFMLRSPIKDTRGPKVQNGPLPVFLKFNTNHLEHCKSELSITCRWLQSVTWELHVQCSLCEPCPKKSRVGTDICIWHGQEGCRHDDCGHYLKLRSLGLSASCKYCVDDVPHLSAEKLEPWTQALVSFKCKEKNGKRKRKMSPECSNKRPNQPEGKKRRQMLPGCSGKRLKQPKVKKGKPKEDELEELGYEIGEDWMVLGRRLGVTKPEIQNLKQQPDKLAERAYQMLLKWKQTKGCDATYQALNDALLHRFVQRKDLAERICLNKGNYCH
ncbi:putative serine/threonine-protein kinase pats1 [Stylophora pistillata]|uniref:Putative serine/threonine-protein kinase pats1 n=1 Tax=Stylophora pistillata TaxID=50429 RepID=A0A2B4RUS5_STYPI|nr:putative serine/threonine-protein kinase pats1 [Stylophora pistillata]